MYALAMEKDFRLSDSVFTTLSNEELLFLDGGGPLNTIVGIGALVVGTVVVASAPFVGVMTGVLTSAAATPVVGIGAGIAAGAATAGFGMTLIEFGVSRF